MTDPMLYAIVLADPGLLISPHPHPYVAVLCGALHAGDEVEVLHEDRSTGRGHVSSVAHQSLSAADHSGQISFADLGPEDLAPGDVIRAFGLETPPLPLEGPEGFRRLHLLHLVQEARRKGFSTSYAPVLEHLPDEAVVLFLEKAVRDALKPPASPHNIRTAFENAALLSEAVGLAEEADRLRLAAAALLEGRPATAALAALASTVAPPVLALKYVRTAEEASQSDWIFARQRGRGRSPTTPELVGQGEAIRRGLQEEGRAVGLGWCPKCKHVVRLNPALRCTRGHDRVKDVRVVVPSEVEETEQLLRRRHG